MAAPAPKADASNDYLLDREKVQRGASYTGLPSVVLEDQAITESMGPILRRSQEHLGTSDIMIIRTRLRLIRAAQALQDKGEIPPRRGPAGVLSAALRWCDPAALRRLVRGDQRPAESVRRIP